MNEIWKQFEKRIFSETRASGQFITQIPSSVVKSRGRTFRAKTDCDFAAGIDGKAVFFDAKALSGKFYFHDRCFTEKIIHQYSALLLAHQLGCRAGYLVWFYEERLIAWIDIRTVEILHSRGLKSVDAKSEGVKYQSDSEKINLKRLLGV